MTNLPAEPKPSLDPAIIEKAPVDLGSQAGNALSASDQEYVELIAKLSARANAAESEVTRLASERTIETVKAKMMEPYAAKVFWFVVGYCLVVALIIVAHGLRCLDLPETLLGIIAGSTAVSVIGLIGIVVSGLFGQSKA